MANGFCPSVLYNIAEVANGNAPGRKVQISGFLQMLMCCQDSNASILQNTYDGGHYKTATVKYRTRPLTSIVQSEDDCDINALPTYSEYTIPALSHKQVSFFIPNSTIYQYCQDVSNMRSVGQPPTRIMNEIYDTFIDHVNALLGSLDQGLVTSMATQFGLNKGSNSSLTFLNINQNGDTLNLQNGVVQLLRDIQENEICGDLCVVGGGIWSGYDMSLAAQCCNAAGMDLSRIGIPRFFFDKNTQTTWGTNQIGVFAPGSVKFLSRQKYEKEAFSGQQGTSFFTTMRFPVSEFNNCNVECLNELTFDVQFKFIDCPTTVTVNGANQTQGPGWQVIIGIDYALYVQPTNLYNASDPLALTNGTWKYVVGNSTYSGGAYGGYAGY